MAACALALVPLGCSYGISVRRSARNNLFNSWRASVVEADDLSPRTRQTLHRPDLDSHHDSAAHRDLADVHLVITVQHSNPPRGTAAGAIV
ncbi:MAG: hypothetical protein JO112_04635 [Planctomycetes bacterium]|nr:hypothetical protein [Planctomycetota bacterium]